MLDSPRLFSRQFDSELKSLDLEAPDPVDAVHSFIVVVEAISVDGERIMLYSDWIYALEPRLFPDLKISKNLLQDDIEKDFFAVIDNHYGLSPDKFTVQIIDDFVRVFRETLAFKIAAKEESGIDDLDSDSVSEYCFWRDYESPLRDKTIAKSKLDSEDIILLENESGHREILFQKWKRSNILEYLSSIQEHYPKLWSNMKQAIVEIESSDSKAQRNKAQYILKHF